MSRTLPRRDIVPGWQMRKRHGTRRRPPRFSRIWQLNLDRSANGPDQTECAEPGKTARYDIRAALLWNNVGRGRQTHHEGLFTSIILLKKVTDHIPSLKQTGILSRRHCCGSRAAVPEWESFTNCHCGNFSGSSGRTRYTSTFEIDHLCFDYRLLIRM